MSVNRDAVSAVLTALQIELEKGNIDSAKDIVGYALKSLKGEDVKAGGGPLESNLYLLRRLSKVFNEEHFGPYGVGPSLEDK